MLNFNYGKWYNGNPLYRWKTAANKHAEFSWSDFPLWYFFLLFGLFAVLISFITIFTKYSKKARLIRYNKINTEESKTYLKKYDRLTRVLGIAIGVFMMFLPLMDSMYDISRSPIESDQILVKIWDYIIGLGWYYQCMLSSFFIGLALVLKKYNFTLIALPIALMGAIRTFIDKDDVMQVMNPTSPNFWRFMFEHTFIVFIPLLFAISQGIKYNKNIFIKTITYSFLMGFVGYVLHWLIILSGTQDIDDWSEMLGVGTILGYEDDWILSHYHYYFWILYIGFGVVIGMSQIAIYNFFFNKSLFINEKWHIRWVKAFMVIIKKEKLPTIKEVQYV